MAIPWDRDPHTAAKHRILERYLQAWWPIMLSSFPRVTYVEGFAGPGVYKGGEPGSPIIALRTLRDAHGPDKPVDLIFIDREPKCLAMLNAEIGKHVTPGRSKSRVHLYHGSAGEELLPRLDAVDAWGGGVFAFLDSWGNVAVPIDVVKRLARRGSEVLVTLGSRFWSQFGSSVGPEWDAMFGSTEWRSVGDIRSGPEKARFLKDCYRRALQSAGFPHVLAFELVDERGQHLYLIHGTTHSLGLEKMKDALWAVDPVTGAGFRDPRGESEGQQTLGLVWQPEIASLKSMIAEWVTGSALSVDAIRQRTLDTTVFKASHATAAVRELVRDELLRGTPAGRITGTTVVSRA